MPFAGNVGPVFERSRARQDPDAVSCCRLSGPRWRLGWLLGAAFGRPAVGDGRTGEFRERSPRSDMRSAGASAVPSSRASCETRWPLPSPVGT